MIRASRRDVVLMLTAAGLLPPATAPEPAVLELLDGGALALDRLRGRVSS